MSSLAETNARGVAIRVLVRVAEEGAYAMRALDGELDRARLSVRDAALATELVYGTLRAQAVIDAAIERCLKDGKTKIDPVARAALRIGAHQILHLSRVPPHAAVDGSVEIVKRARGPRLSGFVNAVLRKIAAQRPAEPSPPDRMSPPPWVAALADRDLPPETRDAMFAVDRAPRVVLRVEDADARDALLTELRACRPSATFEVGSASPYAIVCSLAGDPRSLPGYLEGKFSVQEEGSQLVAQLAGASEGEQILDACAGHGGKATFFARRVGARGGIMAVDLHAPKLRKIAEEFRRLGLPADLLRTKTVDLSVGAGGLSPVFDRVVVDAPCSGLGTIRRRPEILTRLVPDDLARLASLQGSILSTASALVRVGGVLVYAVCSFSSAEGSEVASAFDQAHPGFERIETAPIGSFVAEGGLTRVFPGEGREIDAYQVAMWRRRG